MFLVWFESAPQKEWTRGVKIVGNRWVHGVHSKPCRAASKSLTAYQNSPPTATQSWPKRPLKTRGRSCQIFAREQPRDFPESLRQQLNSGQGAGLGRKGGRGLPRHLAAPEATPQIGSDGNELARRRYLYGFPLDLESGNGRCVVTTNISPGNRVSACQVGLALHSYHLRVVNTKDE